MKDNILYLLGTRLTPDKENVFLFQWEVSLIWDIDTYLNIAVATGESLTCQS